MKNTKPGGYFSQINKKQWLHGYCGREAIVCSRPESTHRMIWKSVRCSVYRPHAVRLALIVSILKPSNDSRYIRSTWWEGTQHKAYYLSPQQMQRLFSKGSVRFTDWDYTNPPNLFFEDKFPITYIHIHISIFHYLR